MSAEQSVNPETVNPEMKDVYKVSQWKWNIDDSSPWWKRFYFKHIFLPFQLFSLKLGIPTPKEVTVEYDERDRVIKRTFKWFEDIGIFDHEDQADRACLAEHWGYKQMPYGRMSPADSAQYSGTVFPRKRNPRRWAGPTLSLVIKDRKQEEREHNQLAQCLSKLNQVLDR